MNLILIVSRIYIWFITVMFSKVSVCPKEGCVCLWVQGVYTHWVQVGACLWVWGVYSHLGRQPLGQTPTLGTHSPRQRVPTTQTPSWADTLLPRRPLKRTVRILLECILVSCLSRRNGCIQELENQNYRSVYIKSLWSSVLPFRTLSIPILSVTRYV